MSCPPDSELLTPGGLVAGTAADRREIPGMPSRVAAAARTVGLPVPARFEQPPAIDENARRPCWQAAQHAGRRSRCAVLSPAAKLSAPPALLCSPRLRRSRRSPAVIAADHVPIAGGGLTLTENQVMRARLGARALVIAQDEVPGRVDRARLAGPVDDLHVDVENSPWACRPPLRTHMSARAPPSSRHCRTAPTPSHRRPPPAPPWSGTHSHPGVTAAAADATPPIRTTAASRSQQPCASRPLSHRPRPPRSHQPQVSPRGRNRAITVPTGSTRLGCSAAADVVPVRGSGQPPTLAPTLRTRPAAMRCSR